MKNPVTAIIYFLPNDDLKIRVMMFMCDTETRAGGQPQAAQQQESSEKRVQVKESEVELSRNNLMS
jgi:hypothetical protein